MEFNQVIGRIRPFQYFQPWRPVERQKIQVILEAARLCSRAVNLAFGKAIVVYRDSLTLEERKALTVPTSEVLFDLAPVYILWYFDMEAQRRAIEEKKWPTVPSGALQDVGAIGPPHGWSHRYVEEVILPEIFGGGMRLPRRGGNPDAGLAMAQGFLTAYDEGLAATLAPFDEEGARRVLLVPETWEPVMAMLVGYPAESWQAAGAEPRLPFEQVFFEQEADQPFGRDEAVARGLTEAGLITPDAPPAWREQEVRALSRVVEAYRTNGARP
jgi:nitroreductase